MADNEKNEKSARISELELKAEQLQAESKLSECLSVLEEVLHLKHDEYGEESEHYQSTSHKLAELCNIIAMIFLNKDKPDSCLEFLRRAEVLSTGSPLFKAITYNNLAQYYKKTNRLKSAVQYLEKAKDIEIKLSDPVLLADTHLNLCALLSQQEKHEEALEHILIGVVLLQDEFNSYLLKKISAKKEQQNGGKAVAGDQNTATTEEKDAEIEHEDVFSKLAIAYHNLGVEFEFLKRYDQSLQTYEKSVQFARVNLGPQHDLTKQFETVYEQAQQSIAEERFKEVQKKKPVSVRATNASQIYQTLDSKKPSTAASKSLQQTQSNRFKNKQSQEQQNLSNINKTEPDARVSESKQSNR